MADEMNKLNTDELDEVSGGKHHTVGKRDSIADCPPGTIEVKNEQLKNTQGKKSKCPYCGNKKNLEDHFFYMVDTGKLVEGQSCSCGQKWITQGCG